jgi:hypothetical protein
MLTRRDKILLDTLLPQGAHPEMPLGIADVNFDAYYADFKRSAMFPMWIGFVAALFVAIWIAPLLIRKLPPITLYDRDTRERILMALYNSKYNILRQIIFLLKATVSFCYGADDRVRDALGYPIQFDSPRGRAAAAAGLSVQPLVDGDEVKL